MKTVFVSSRSNSLRSFPQAAAAVMLFCGLMAWPPANAARLEPAYDMAKAAGSEPGAANLIAYGRAAGDGYGRVVRTGDINGDGFDDLVVAAPGGDVGTPLRNDAGAVYIWLGGPDLAGAKDVALAAGSGPNVTIMGASLGDQLGAGGAVLIADINGDGIADLLLGSSVGDGPGELRNNCGEAYVVFGRSAFPPVLDLATQGEGGADVTVYGASNDDNMGAGGALAVADLTGDGRPELIFGSPLGDGPDETRISCGEVAVVLGRAVLPPVLDLRLGDAEVTIAGATPNDFLSLGGSLACGDVNGDGLADLVVGASGGDGPGEARGSAGELYVLLGRPAFPAAINLAVQGEGGADVTFWGASASDQLAASGAMVVGDFDGDGLKDIIVGASGGDGPGEARGGCGEAYVIRGRSSWPLSLDMSIAADLIIYGATASDSMTSAGAMALADLNGDGVADLILGAPLADGPSETRLSAGEAAIVFGGSLAAAVMDLAEGNAPVIYGASAGDNLTIGKTLLVADLNGNGFPEILLGAPMADGPAETRANGGEVYAVEGRDTLPTAIDLAMTGAAGARVTFFGATANDQLATGAALAAGDLNGDGVADLVLGTPNGDGPGEGRSNAGEVNVVFGVAEPEIEVAQPAAEDVSSGGVRSFGNVGVGGLKRLHFTIRNTGNAPLRDIALTMTGEEATAFAITATPAPMIAKGASTTFTIEFSPIEIATKEAVVAIASDDSDEAPFIIHISGHGVVPVPPLVTTSSAEITGLTAATLRGVVNGVGTEREVVFDYGTTLDYGSSVAAEPGIIGGSTDAEVSVALSGLLPRTLYHFRVRAFGDLGAAAGQDFTFVTPNQPPVAVADVFYVLPGTTVILPVLANDTDAEGDVLDLTQITKILPARDGKVALRAGNVTFEASKKFDGATFHYTIDDGYGGTAKGAVTLVPGTCAVQPPAMTVSAFGATYDVSVTSNAFWTAKKEHSWIKVTPASGTGNGVVQVTVLPQDDHHARKGTVVIGGAKHEILQTGIGMLPPELAGHYQGLVQRHVDLNENLGGAFEMAVTSKGAFSGKVTNSRETACLAGRFLPTTEGGPWESVVVLSRKGSANVTLHLTLDQTGLTGELGGGSAGDAAITAWLDADNGLGLVGCYLFSIEHSSSDSLVPAGSGALALLVSRSGGTFTAGRLADGEIFTCAGRLGREGQVAIFDTLYGNEGSVQGTVQVAPATEVLTGEATWLVLPRIKGGKKNAVTLPGFGPVPLSLTGSANN